MILKPDIRHLSKDLLFSTIVLISGEKYGLFYAFLLTFQKENMKCIELVYICHTVYLVDG